MKKKTVLVLSDHPLSPSGVGTQTKYFIEALLSTNRYKFICLGGAMKHQDYSPMTVDPYGRPLLFALFKNAVSTSLPRGNHSWRFTARIQVWARVRSTRW